MPAGVPDMGGMKIKGTPYLIIDLYA